MYIDDILESMNKIQSYITGLEYTNFVENDMVIDKPLIEEAQASKRRSPEKDRRRGEK